MSIQQSAVRFGQRRVMKRLGRSLPFLGVAFALVSIGTAIRRKGVVGGTMDSALNAVPFVGSLKNVAELVRGRDFIADKMSAATGPR